MTDATYDRSSFLASLKALGMTQRAFAARAGVHPTTVYKWGVDDPFPAWVKWLMTTLRFNRYMTERTTRTHR